MVAHAPEGPWSHEQAIVDDVRLHYVTAGDEGDPLVVLLHGFPEFWYSWRDQLPGLAESGFRVVAPDMRGYNRSEKPRGVASYRMDELVGDVVGLVDHLGEDAARVVGHDWGGVVAWETAIRRPETVERLAVLNAPHPGRFREVLARDLGQWRRSWYALWFQVPRLPEAILGAFDCAGVGSLFRSTANPDTFDEFDLERYRNAACRPGALTAALNYYRALFREGLREETLGVLGGDRPSRAVRVPSLLVWGERDPALGPALTEGLDKWVPDLRVERLPEATHWVHHDSPEIVERLLEEFFGA